MINHPKALIELVKERIQDHGNPQKITQLCLDQILLKAFTHELIEVVERCQNLEHLSVASSGLESLSLLPKLPKLRYLDLQQNAFTQKNLIELRNQYQNLSGLNISQNKIASIEAIIDCVNRLQIKEINIFETPAFESNPKIIETLFENCKTLQCINWEDRRGKEVKQFEAESSDRSSQNESQNNGKNYSYENQEISQMEDEMSLQSSKKIKIQ